MVVNFRGKDLNAAGVRVSGTKITATPDEINQALDGIAADVTAANLSALTGGAETALHSHAASGGGSGVGFLIRRLAFTTDGTYQTVDFPNSGNYEDQWSDDPDPALPPAGWTFNAGRDGLVVPVDGRYLMTEIVTWNQHATDWQAVLVSPTGPSGSTGVVPPATVLDLSSLGVSATHTQETKLRAGQAVVFELQTAGGLTSVVVSCSCQYLGPLPS